MAADRDVDTPRGGGATPQPTAPSRVLCDHAIVRVVPRVEREEFVNVGAIVCATARGVLAARVVVDEALLRAFAPGLDLVTLRAHLSAIPRICAGDADAGPIAALPLRARFDWLTARRSTIVQTSAVHAGFTDDPHRCLDALVESMVQRR